MTMVAIETLRQIDDLQSRYVDALDRRDMEGWLATFGATGSYRLSTAEGEEAGLPIAMILDDCPERLRDRVTFVNRVWAGTYQEYRTRHIVQRLGCEAVEPGLYRSRSSFFLAFTRSDTRATELYASGIYEDLIEIEGSRALFRSKAAITDAPMLPHYLTFPI